MNLSRNYSSWRWLRAQRFQQWPKTLRVGTGETDGYRLVWQDLFDDSELRRTVWNIRVVVQAAAT